MFFSVVHYYVNSFYILSADMLFKILFFTEVCPNDIVYLENWSLSPMSVPKNSSLWEELQSSVKPILNVDCIQQIILITEYALWVNSWKKGN